MYTYLREQTIAMKYKFTLYLNCTKIKLIFDIDTDSIYIYFIVIFSFKYKGIFKSRTTQNYSGIVLLWRGKL